MASTIGMILTPPSGKVRPQPGMPPSLAAAWSWPYLRPRSVRPPFPEGKQAEDGAFFVACSLCVWWPAARGSDPPFTLCPPGEDSTTLTVTAAQQFPPRVHGPFTHPWGWLPSAGSSWGRPPPPQTGCLPVLDRPSARLQARTRCSIFQEVPP